MASYTFQGGVRLPENEDAKKYRIKSLPAPGRLTLPLAAWGGKRRAPLVRAGETVLLGQKIAEDPDGSYPLHSPVSGSVESVLTDGAGRESAIVLENDGEERRDPALVPYRKSLLDSTGEELLAWIKKAGIPLYDEGGEALCDRLSMLLGHAKTVILNGVRREPWITGGYRLLLENPGAVIGGLKILLKLLSVRSAVFALEDRCKELSYALAEIDFDPALLRTVHVRSKYPGWTGNPLVYAATGKKLPGGMTPAECGILVVSPECLAAVYQCFVDGIPAVRRILTLDGQGILKGGNYYLPFGTPLLPLLRARRKEGVEISEKECALVSGGLMNGRAVDLKSCFVTPETGALYLLRKESFQKYEGRCIRCGKCVERCPVHLAPIRLWELLKRDERALAGRLALGSCIGCGVCSFVCPVGVPLYEGIYPAVESAGRKMPEEKAAEDGGENRPSPDALPREAAPETGVTQAKEDPEGSPEIKVQTQSESGGEKTKKRGRKKGA